MFNVMDMTNNGKNVFREITGLSLEHNTTYYVFVIGADLAGNCNMNYTEVLDDLTAPIAGKIKVGPDYDMVSIEKRV